MSRRIVTGLTAAVTLLTAAIAAGAFVLSYQALYQTGLDNGVPATLVYLWPLLIDTPLVVFTLALLAAQLMRHPGKLWAGLVILYTLATIGFNLSHARPTPLGWLVAIVAPVGLLLTTEALRHLARMTIERQAVVESLAELAAQAATKAQDLQRLEAQIAGKQAQYDALKADITAAKSSNLQEMQTKAQQAKQASIDTRRAQVLQLLQAGNDDKVIAAHLGRDVRTIRADIVALNGKARTP